MCGMLRMTPGQHFPMCVAPNYGPAKYCTKEEWRDRDERNGETEIRRRKGRENWLSRQVHLGHIGVH